MTGVSTQTPDNQDGAMCKPLARLILSKDPREGIDRPSTPIKIHVHVITPTDLPIDVGFKH